MGGKTSGRRKAYKYVGSEFDQFVYGEYYTYKDMQGINGLGITTLRNRMRHFNQSSDGEYVITDCVLKPKSVVPFQNLDGTITNKAVPDCLTERCETESEKMMNKYLRLAL